MRQFSCGHFLSFSHSQALHADLRGVPGVEQDMDGTGFVVPDHQTGVPGGGAEQSRDIREELLLQTHQADAWGWAVIRTWSVP